jgi:hypothetical protein
VDKQIHQQATVELRSSTRRGGAETVTGVDCPRRFRILRVDRLVL